MYQSRPILDNWNHDNIVVRSINLSKLCTAINIQRKNITWGYKGSENRKRNAITEVSKQTIYGLLFLPWLGKVLVMIGEISAGNILRRDRTLAWSSSPSPLLKDRRGMKKKMTRSWQNYPYFRSNILVSYVYIHPFHYFGVKLN